jgi:hypothetical protein
MTSLPLATQRLFAQIVSSPRRSFASRLAALLGRPEPPNRAELAKLRPAARFLIVGLAAWIGLVGLVTVIAVASVEMSTVSLSAWFGERASASARAELRSPAGFENIVQRPLFSSSRRGRVVVVAAPPPPPSAPVLRDRDLTLKGVYISGALTKAFLKSPKDPRGTWVQVNEEITGWRVVDVKPDQVVLDAQDEKLVIPLANGRTK